MRLPLSLLFAYTLSVASFPSAADGLPGTALPGFPDLSTGDMEQIAEVLYLKPICDSVKPGFSQAVAAGYTRWATERQALIASIDRSMRAGAPPDAKRPEPTVARKAEAAKQCDRIQRFLEHSHPDPRFATPEKTWETYLAAMQAGQRDVALDCLDDMGRRKTGELIASESPEFLRQISTGFTALKPMRDYDGTMKVFSTTRKDMAASLVFVRMGGEWKFQGF
jgi:hypothetical protein